MFRAIAQADPDFHRAYARAAATIPRFIEHIESGVDGFTDAKLRFRDPDESERLGEDQLFFLWLTDIQFHAESRMFSGTFFEVPREIQKWHQVGQQLSFEAEDIFDWSLLTKDGRLFGGYTLRVTREKLPEEERADYDRYIGVRIYEPEE